MIFEYSFEYFSILRIYSYSYSVNFQFPNIFDIRIRPKINIRDNTDKDSTTEIMKIDDQIGTILSLS